MQMSRFLLDLQVDPSASADDALTRPEVSGFVEACSKDTKAGEMLRPTRHRVAEHLGDLGASGKASARATRRCRKAVRQALSGALEDGAVYHDDGIWS